MLQHFQETGLISGRRSLNWSSLTAKRAPKDCRLTSCREYCARRGPNNQADTTRRIWASSSLFYGTYCIVSKMNIALQVSLRPSRSKFRTSSLALGPLRMYKHPGGRFLPEEAFGVRAFRKSSCRDGRRRGVHAMGQFRSFSAGQVALVLAQNPDPRTTVRSSGSMGCIDADPAF